MPGKGEAVMTVAGTVIFVWCLIPVFTGKILNIGNATGMAAGVVMLLTGIRPGWTGHLPVAIGVGIKVLVVLICALVVTESALMVRACMRKPGEDDTLVVLGCTVYGETPSRMLYERIHAAEDYLRTHPQAKAVLSGGQGKEEKISEAGAMYRTMVDDGIDASRLFMEARSTSTRENLDFSLQVIREHQLNEHIAIATNEFHMYRAGVIAEKLGLSYAAVPAHTSWWLFATFYIRELYGILHEWTQ